MIAENVHRILDSIPPHVTVLAAAKTRSVEEVREAYQAGITHFGHNYVQEASAVIPVVNADLHWHMIGHLQRNKAKIALTLFDRIDSLDSIRLADEIEKHAATLDKTIRVMIEVNIGEENAKTGIDPEHAKLLAAHISALPHLRLMGLMTMGPRFGDPEDSRIYFKKTRQIYDAIGTLNLPGVELKVLSMGMSNDYMVAIQEGATLIRLGTAIFGERKT
ncbi:MAG: YggS family pyridoxal phosphate-dependent enzyme [Chloroflexi bacterium]|nr:YggS family pyridoxal phosphate-dependent enzyme [Chloroflexota bacterium]